MGIDPPATDDVFDGDFVTEDTVPDPESLDRQWVVEEAAATFGLSLSETERWIEGDGVQTVYVRIQEHWTRPADG